MGNPIGLGKKSPIPIEADPEKYEGLIIRHGQWVRWSIAKKCTCLLAANRADPRCPICRGSGWRYRFQETDDEYQLRCVIVDQNTVEMPIGYEDAVVKGVFLPSGETVPVQAVYGRWIRTIKTLKEKGTAFVSAETSRVKTVPADAAVYAGHGIVKLSKNEYESQWATIPFDLVSLTSLKRSDGSALTVTSWSVDKIAIDTSIIEPVVGEHLVINAKYMPPFKMAVLQQNLSLSDRNMLQEIGGDSMVIHPFAHKVGEYDTITLWAGTQVRKKVVRRGIADIDFLPDLFVSDIISLTTKERSYSEGTDFVLWDRNSIRWLLADVDRPQSGTYFAVEYSANVTYRVIQQLPNVRSSENKRFPSRVAVKLEVGTSGTDQI